MQKRVDIVILNYNTCDITAKCLRSIKRMTNLENVRVILWDNGSKDGSREYFRQAEWNWIEYIYNDVNLGFAKACNMVMRQSTADYFLLLNSDTEALEPYWLETLAAVSAQHGNGIVGCKLVYPNGLIQHAGGFIKQGWALGPECGDHYGRFAPASEHSTIRTDIDYVTGACLLIPRMVTDRIGFLDERFFFAGEDVEFCQRVKRHGMKVVYAGNVMLMHYESYSSRKAKNNG